MAIEKFQFLDKQSVELIALQLLNKSQTRFNERIVTRVDESSTDKQVASARALYKFINERTAVDANIVSRLDGHDSDLSNIAATINSEYTYQSNQNNKLGSIEADLNDLSGVVEALTHITYTSIIGSIDTVIEPRDNVIYLQKDDENDPSWMLYVYKNGGWINVGDTEVNLNVIWSKDEVAELREALGIHEVEAISDNDILSIIDETYADSEEDFSAPSAE